MNNLILREYNGNKIRIRDDRYVNLTDMAKASGKKFKHWNSLKSSHEYLEVLSSVVGIPTTQLIQSVSGGIPELQGTYAHPEVAIRFAKWCSPEFAVHVNFWIDELATTGKVDLTGGFDIPKTYGQALKLAYEQQIVIEEQLLEIEELKRNAEFRDYLVAQDQTWYDMKQTAKILFDKYQFKIGRNKLFEVLRDKRILMDNNEPYQQYVTRGLFKVNVYDLMENEVHVSAHHTVVSPKGTEFIYKLLLKDNIPQEENPDYEN